MTEEELQMPASGVFYERTTPCDDCPFLRATPHHEGIAGSIPQYLGMIERNVFAHTCHKTDTRPQCNGPVRGRADLKIKTQHCAGAVIMLKKTGKGADLQLPLLNATLEGRLKWADFTDPEDKVYKLHQFLDSYIEFLKSKLRTRSMKKQKGFSEIGIVFVVLAVVVFCALKSYKPAVQVERKENGSKIEKLFEQDGCSVYRFWDGMTPVYFGTCPSTAQYWSGGKNNKRLHQAVTVAGGDLMPYQVDEIQTVKS